MTIRRRIDDGTLRAYKVGPRAVRIERASVANLMSPVSD